MSTNKFYVYIYYHPTTMVPFYVGKGYSDRSLVHLKEAKNWNGKMRKGKNAHKLNTIKSIIDQGLEPLIVRTFHTNDETQAFAEEVRLIKLFGRADLFQGSLTNLTDGGEGLAGYKHSKEQKDRMSASRTGPANGMFGKTHTPEVRERMSKLRKGKPGTPHTEELKQSRIGNDNNAKRRKTIYKMDLDGTIVESYPSFLNAVKMTSIPKATLHKNVKYGGLPIDGFFYQYEPVIHDRQELIARRTLSNSNQTNVRKVEQVLNGEIITTFDSIKQAAITVGKLGGNYANLWYKIRDEKPYVGYVWRYSNPI